jgi:hypothetical protein
MHPCRQSGVLYLQCLKESLPITSSDDTQVLKENKF